MTKRPHIIDGEFQSDKYPTCPRGKVPLSVKDPTAQDLLWEYAQRRREVDADFSTDLEACLLAAGFHPAAQPATCALGSSTCGQERDALRADLARVSKVLADVEVTRDRQDDLRAWAMSRIALCRVAIEASPENATATLGLVGERRALEAALRILAGEETPR